MSEIDWDVELRKIEREYDGLPPEPSIARLRAERAALLRKQEEAVTRRALLGAWARLLLVGALAASLYWWPYGRACGVPLGAFLAATVMVTLGGLWIAAHTWRYRLATSHTVALTLLVGGLALVASEVLPRTGVATVRWVNAAGWACDAGASTSD